MADEEERLFIHAIRTSCVSVWCGAGCFVFLKWSSKSRVQWVFHKNSTSTLSRRRGESQSFMAAYVRRWLEVKSVYPIKASDSASPVLQNALNYWFYSTLSSSRQPAEWFTAHRLLCYRRGIQHSYFSNYTKGFNSWTKTTSCPHPVNFIELTEQSGK